MEFKSKTKNSRRRVGSRNTSNETNNPIKEELSTLPNTVTSEATTNTENNGKKEITTDETVEDMQCGICFEQITVRGELNSCAHKFCFTCIDQWAKTSNTCPMCKARFKQLTKIDTSAPNKRSRSYKIKDVDQRPDYDGPDSWFEYDSDDDFPIPSLLGPLIFARALSIFPLFSMMNAGYNIFDDDDDEEEDEDGFDGEPYFDPDEIVDLTQDDEPTFFPPPRLFLPPPPPSFHFPLPFPNFRINTNRSRSGPNNNRPRSQSTSQSRRSRSSGSRTSQPAINTTTTSSRNSNVNNNNNNNNASNINRNTHVQRREPQSRKRRGPY